MEGVFIMGDIASQVNQFKADYYLKNKKNSLFKEKQKAELAALICQKFNIEQLIEATVRILENTNIVYIDYTLFKLFVNEALYDTMVNIILQKFDIVIKQYGNFQCYINIDGFTITAAQRYQSLISHFCNKCVEINSTHTESLQSFKIYNPASIMEPIRKLLGPFVHKDIKHKIEIISKENSVSELQKLNL